MLTVAAPQMEKALGHSQGQLRVRHPPGPQRSDSQSSFPPSSLPFSCTLFFLQSQPVPFTPCCQLLEAEDISEPMETLQGEECINTTHTMQF